MLLIFLSSVLGHGHSHMEALTVSNSELKRTMRQLLSAPITADSDPLVDGYNRTIRGTALDFENRENTLKEVQNINTPLLLRVPATRELYVELLHHD